MAFTTPEGSFESTIMFFGLTNSLATFQMMNKLLIMLRSKIIDLVVPYLLFSFYFIFDFSIFRTLGLGLEVIGHTVISDGMVTTLITGLERRK